jgi:hypothetical protein
MKPLLFKDQLSLRHNVFNPDVSLRSCLTVRFRRLAFALASAALRLRAQPSRLQAVVGRRGHLANP